MNTRPERRVLVNTKIILSSSLLFLTLLSVHVRVYEFLRLKVCCIAMLASAVQNANPPTLQ